MFQTVIMFNSITGEEEMGKIIVAMETIQIHACIHLAFSVFHWYYFIMRYYFISVTFACHIVWSLISHVIISISF
jgi:hypothetical protein